MILKMMIILVQIKPIQAKKLHHKPPYVDLVNVPVGTAGSRRQ